MVLGLAGQSRIPMDQWMAFLGNILLGNYGFYMFFIIECMGSRSKFSHDPIQWRMERVPNHTISLLYRSFQVSTCLNIIWMLLLWAHYKQYGQYSISTFSPLVLNFSLKHLDHLWTYASFLSHSSLKTWVGHIAQYSSSFCPNSIGSKLDPINIPSHFTSHPMARAHQQTLNIHSKKKNHDISHIHPYTSSINISHPYRYTHS